MTNEQIIKQFREKFVASDGRFLTGTETVGKAESFILQVANDTIKEIADKEVDCELKGYYLAYEEMKEKQREFLEGFKYEPNKELLEAIKKMKK